MQHPMNRAGLNFQGNLVPRIAPMPLTTVDMLPQTLIADTSSAFRGDPSAFLAPMQLQQQQQAQSGALTQNPGLLSSLMTMMPQAPTQEFDPRNALMAGALSGLSDIILKRPLSNRPMQLMNFAQQRFDRDQARDFQQQQANFQNALGLGTLAASLQKAGLPSSTAGKLARDLFNKDLNDLSDTELTQLGTVAKQFGSGTTIQNITNEGLGTLTKQRATNAAKIEAELDAIVAGAPGTQAIIEQLEFLNAGIESSGLLGNLADGINRGLGSVGIDFRVSGDTTFREAYRGLSNKLGLSELQFFKGPTTDFEFGVAASISGNLDQTPEGREILLALAKGRSMMNQESAQAYLDWALSFEGIPSRGKFTKSDAYKQLQLKSQYTLNPGSLGQVMAALPQKMRKAQIQKREDEITRRYKAAYPDESAEKITELVDKHTNLELGL